MENPLPAYDVHKRILQFLKSGQVSDQILEIVQTAFISALSRENIVLSRPEKNRLAKEVTISVLEDILAEIKTGKRADFSN
jgi:hypothetical protein